MADGLWLFHLPQRREPYRLDQTIAVDVLLEHLRLDHAHGIRHSGGNSCQTREHTEGVIHILDRARNMRVVTVIEVLSPSNKEPHAKGWELYRQKQGEILRRDVHLVEIDLLRAGEYTLAPPYHVLVGEVGAQWHYMMSIRRADEPENFLLYPRTIRERLPRIPVPLAIGDREVCLDLQAVLDQCYEDGAYEDIVDYRRDPPPPPLSADDLEWLYLRLRQLGRR